MKIYYKERMYFVFILRAYMEGALENINSYM